MGIPILLILFSMMVSLFLVGAAALLLSKGDWRLIVIGLILIIMGSFIAYGLNTGCESDDIYIYCGDE
jgi:cell division protein FtsW (lipid II flippase)